MSSQPQLTKALLVVDGGAEGLLYIRHPLPVVDLVWSPELMLGSLLDLELLDVVELVISELVAVFELKAGFEVVKLAFEPDFKLVVAVLEVTIELVLDVYFELVKLVELVADVAVELVPELDFEPVELMLEPLDVLLPEVDLEVAKLMSEAVLDVLRLVLVELVVSVVEMLELGAHVIYIVSLAPVSVMISVDMVLCAAAVTVDVLVVSVVVAVDVLVAVTVCEAAPVVVTVRATRNL
jgi:hypothetical protein